MHFVNQVNLESALSRGVLNIIKQLPGVLDSGAGSRIHFDQINQIAAINALTGRALTTRLGADPRFAIQRLGKYSRQCGLAHSPGPGKQKGMMDTLIVQCISQCGNHVCLTNHLRKDLWPPFSRQCQITH